MFNFGGRGEVDYSCVYSSWLVISKPKLVLLFYQHAYAATKQRIFFVFVLVVFMEVIL